MQNNESPIPTKQNFGVGAQISFIIVVHKGRVYLERCLASVFKNCENIRKEIIIVNNGDELLSASEDVRIISAENKGFGNACNLGAKEALGDILCFLNPDTEILTNIKEPTKYFNANNDIGVIGAKLVDEKDDIQEWCAGKEINLLDIICNNLGFKRSKEIWESKKEIDCAWVSGACLFIQKELFQKLNGFDENFFMYFEDIDLCKRAKKSGYKIIYYPEFIVKHFGGKSFENKKEQKKIYYTSQDYYFQKHFGKMKHNLLKLIRKLTFK